MEIDMAQPLEDQLSQAVRTSVHAIPTAKDRAVWKLIADRDAELEAQRPKVEPGTIFECTLYCKFECGASFTGGNTLYDRVMHEKACNFNPDWIEKQKETCASAITMQVATPKKAAFTNKGIKTGKRAWKKKMPVQESSSTIAQNLPNQVEEPFQVEDQAQLNEQEQEQELPQQQQETMVVEEQVDQAMVVEEPNLHQLQQHQPADSIAIAEQPAFTLGATTTTTTTSKPQKAKKMVRTKLQEQQLKKKLKLVQVAQPEITENRKDQILSKLDQESIFNPALLLPLPSDKEKPQSLLPSSTITSLQVMHTHIALPSLPPLSFEMTKSAWPSQVPCDKYPKHLPIELVTKDSQLVQTTQIAADIAKSHMGDILTTVRALA